MSKNGLLEEGIAVAKKPKELLDLDAAPSFFSPQTLARILGVGETRAYELAKTAGFPALRIGRRLLISKKGLLKWLHERGLA